VTADPRDRFRSQIAEALGVPPDHVSLFGRGRVALYAILRALEIGQGDEVIVPAFTCVAVPNPILYLGARPVWVDIDAATYLIDPAGVEAAITPRTRAILAQNTFGLSADLDALAAIADRHGLTVIDDSTHGLGGRYRGMPSGATAALSFFSTQWSKPLSTGLGGFAVARDDGAATRLRAIEAAAIEPSALRVRTLSALIYARERAGRGPVFRAGRATYRALSRLGVIPGSSSRDELEGSAMPPGFVARLSTAQARLGSDRIGRLATDVAERRAIAHRYSAWLRERGLTAAADAVRAGVDLGDWFVSPIHPVTERLDRWAYAAGTAPIAEQACRAIVNLPTDPDLGADGIDRVLEFLADQATLIL
jgi:perosamine synthetase